MRLKTSFLFLVIFFSTFINDAQAFFCGSPATCLEPLPIFAKPECGRAFITLGGGYSWSNNVDMCVNTYYWDVTNEGYDGDLHQSEFYTLALGYHTQSIFSFSVEMDYRPNYSYHKYQTLSSDSSALGTRHFSLYNTTYTFNAFLNKEGNYANWNFRNCFIIAPFVGGGLGVAYNTLYDFHTVDPKVSGYPQEVRSIMNSKQRTTFAGQVTIGFTTKLNCRLSIDFGYRWFYGGRFESNDYFTNVSEGVDAYPQKTSPWTGKVKANELYVNVNYNL